MVFDPSVAPTDREGFLAWYGQQTRWAEGHDYNDPNTCSPPLNAWFMSMIREFPPMNGPLRSESAEAPWVTSYSIGRSIIYIAFAWSVAERAYHATFDAAKAEGLGFFDASGRDGEVWMMMAGDHYACVHKGWPDGALGG